MGQCVEKIAHSCGTSDGLQVFEDGEGGFNGYCFSCGEYVSDPYDGGEPPKFTPKSAEQIRQEVDSYKELPTVALEARRLKKEYLKKYGVRFELDQSDGSTPRAVAFPYTDESGQLCAWKVRLLDDKRRMWSVGNMKEVDLFGWQTAKRSGSKRLYITEGEFDAVALYQILAEKNKGTAYEDQQHAVVSLPHGAGCAKKALNRMMHRINEVFKEVVLVFDTDDAGVHAAEEVCRLFPEVMSAKLPCKDANACIMEGASKAAHSAVVFGPSKPKNSRIVYGSSLREAASAEPKLGLSWPWEGMTKATRGIRRGETLYFGAGVKMGKSEFVNSIASHLIVEHQLPVYMVKPEEALPKSYKLLLGKVAGRIFHDPTIPFDHEAFDAADKLVGDRAIFQDVYQFVGWEHLKQDIIYTVVNEGVQDVMIDPITCLTNTMSASQANEHLVKCTAELSAMAKDLDFTAYIFCHLKAPEHGAPHERGGEVLSNQFAGSRAMMRACNYMFGIEGNKSPDLDIHERNCRTLKILEDREFGSSETIELYWDYKTGLFSER